jgi:hypothetical protein
LWLLLILNFFIQSSTHEFPIFPSNFKWLPLSSSNQLFVSTFLFLELFLVCRVLFFFWSLGFPSDQIELPSQWIFTWSDPKCRKLSYNQQYQEHKQRRTDKLVYFLSISIDGIRMWSARRLGMDSLSGAELSAEFFLQCEVFVL